MQSTVVVLLVKVGR